MRGRACCFAVVSASLTAACTGAVVEVTFCSVVLGSGQ